MTAFDDNTQVPPEEMAGAFDEYSMPEGDVTEKAQTATHLFRAKRSSLLELRAQLVEKKLEIDFNIARIDAQLEAC